jgi:alanine racemase
MAANLRLTIDRAALAHNWRTCERLSGAAAAGAAVKADGYGLGAQAVVDVLAAAGCRDFFVATWTEAGELTMPPGTRLAVLHGVQSDELPVALASDAVPVLCTPAQIATWRDAAPGRVCDVMLDSGINRLGIGAGDLALLTDLDVDILHSHLACADTPASPHNAAQAAALRAAAAAVPLRRVALANSAGIRLGADYHFDLTRPGLALYGGGPEMLPVVRLSARVVQVRDVPAGGSVGYGATWTARRPSRIAVVNLGYADGYPRALSNAGHVVAAGVRCPVAGRVSMDLIAADVTGAAVAEGDWLDLDFDLAATAAAAGVTQYELLTGLGRRYARVQA